jgi:hypothetical protein
LAAVRVQQAVPITVRESRVTGRVLPPHPGAVVWLSRSNEQGQDEEEWTEVARTRLSARSTFSFALTGLRPRRGFYHVFRPADEDHGTGTSKEFRIR